MSSSRRHLRNAIGAVLLALAAVVLAAAHVPAEDHLDLERPASATQPTPPLLLPDTPTAQAVAAAEATTTTTSAPTTTSTAPSTTVAESSATNTPPVPREERVRDLVDYPFEQRAPRWSVDFRPPERSGLLGYADHTSRQIVVYLHADQSDRALAYTLAHEMGHALDALHLTAEERRAYRELRGISTSLDWLWEWDGGADGDFSMPAGDFAEAFAVTAVGDATFWESRLAGPPSDGQQQAILALLDDD